VAGGEKRDGIKKEKAHRGAECRGKGNESRYEYGKRIVGSFDSDHDSVGIRNRCKKVVID